MGTGVSLILIAVGAILTWAVNASVHGLNVHAIGVILMVVGLVGFVLDMLFWSSWGPRASSRRRVTTYQDPGLVAAAPVARPTRQVVVERPARQVVVQEESDI
jgi:hypothetical protein